MEEGARRIVDAAAARSSPSTSRSSPASRAVRAGGIGIVAAADIAISAEDATFALTEVKLGLAAAIISLTVHHRMNPRAAALTTLGGEVFSGAEAAAYGLVTKAVPAERLDAEVGRVCAAWPPAPRRGCASRSGSSTATWSPASTRTARRWPRFSARLFASDEAREAMTAFLSARSSAPADPRRAQHPR